MFPFRANYSKQVGLFNKGSRLGKTSTPEKVFIWDVGGVILHWDPRGFLTAYQAGKFLPHYQDIFGDSWKNFDNGDLSSEDLIELFHKKLKVDREEIRIFMKAVLHSIKPNFATIELIQQLKKYGHRHYCLTNGSQEYLNFFTSDEYRKVYGFSLNDLFNEDEIVLSAPLKISKPDKAIYQHSVGKFKINNAEIIFTDDTEVNIKGAEIANWHYPIHYKGYDDLKEKIEQILKINLSLDDLVNSAFGHASNTARRLR